jgi:hypothetical protein
MKTSTIKFGIEGCPRGDNLFIWVSFTGTFLAWKTNLTAYHHAQSEKEQRPSIRLHVLTELLWFCILYLFEITNIEILKYFLVWISEGQEKYLRELSIIPVGYSPGVLHGSYRSLLWGTSRELSIKRKIVFLIFPAFQDVKLTDLPKDTPLGRDLQNFASKYQKEVSFGLTLWYSWLTSSRTFYALRKYQNIDVFLQNMSIRTPPPYLQFLVTPYLPSSSWLPPTCPAVLGYPLPAQQFLVIPYLPSSSWLYGDLLPCIPFPRTRLSWSKFLHKKVIWCCP